MLTVKDLVDANAQLMQGVMSVSGNREHGTTREAPLKRFVETEQTFFNSLPAVPPELVMRGNGSEMLSIC